MRARTKAAGTAALLAFAAAATFASMPASSASSSVVVTMDVASATTLITSACEDPGTPGRLAIGTVLPGAAARSPLCTLTFGSSNDTAALRLHQQDGQGSAMWAYGDGALATGWATSGVLAPAIANAQQSTHAVVAPDGDTIIGGSQRGTWNPMLQRIDSSGSLDAAFDGAVGGNGHVTYAGYGPAFSDLGMQGDNIIATIGNYLTSSAWVVRVLPNGNVDSTFGTAGSVVIPVAGLDESLEAAEVLPDGKILVAGSARTSGEQSNHTSGRLLLVRLLPNGALDPAFGTGGVVIDDVTAASDLATDLVVAADGSIYVSMSAAGSICSGQMQRLARYSSTGVRDAAGWGAPDGWVCGVAGGHRIALAHDGRLLAASNDDRMGKYLPTGAPDPSFGVAGVSSPGFWTSLGAPYVDAQGRILRAGTSGGATPASRVIRVLPNGALDTTFGTGGVIDVQVTGGGTDEELIDIVPGVDGRLAAVGAFDIYGSGDAYTFMLERAGIVSDYGANTWTPSATTSAFGVCMQSATSAATTWTTNATCPQTNGAYWRAVPATWGDPNAPVATTAVGVNTATVALRFGARAGDNLRPGTYTAPVAFSLVAPSV